MSMLYSTEMFVHFVQTLFALEIRHQLAPQVDD